MTTEPGVEYDKYINYSAHQSDSTILCFSMSPHQQGKMLTAC